MILDDHNLAVFLSRTYLYVSGDFHVMVESGSKIKAVVLLPHHLKKLLFCRKLGREGGK